LANLESGGFHFYGHSSRGKTTSAQVAASVFGCGADPAENAEKSYIQRWNSTVNALEGLAAAHNHGLMVLDELHTCESREFGKVIYNLFGGKGKSRMNKDLELKQSRVWQLLLLSTGEKSTQAHMEETKQHVYAGQKVRLMDIPTGDNIIIESNGRPKDIFTRDLKKACSKYYGTAVPKFIEWLTKRFDNFHVASSVVEDRLNLITASLIGEKVEPEHRRAIQRLALVQLAGEFAGDAAILKYEKSEISKSIQMIRKAWCTEELNLPEYVQGAIKVQEFTIKNVSRFMGCYDEYAPRDLIGFKEGNSYMYSPQGFFGACSGYDIKLIAKYIGQLNYLVHDHGRLQNYPTTPKGKMRCYTIKNDFISHQFSTIN
jgi:uncharacterized protein (DUF927 family)